MSSTVGLAHFLQLKSPDGVIYRFQNFFIGSPAGYYGAAYEFLPFGFSGATYNRSGENSQAELVFPNRQLVRDFIDRAVMRQWVATVDTVLITDVDAQEKQKLYSYTGQVGGGTCKGADLMLSLGSVLDAVTANIPLRNLDAEQVGPLPISGNVQL